MSAELWIPKIKEVARPISHAERQSLLADVRSWPTDIDGQRDIPWQRGRIYFHSLQDTGFVAETGLEPTAEETRLSQACFVKDLDAYLAGLKNQDRGIQQVFQSILETGTSAYWHKDPNMVANLNRVYLDVDRKLIRPWVDEERSFLKYAELIQSNGHPLAPSQIPVHPMVYLDPSFYSDEFVNKVRNAVPESIREDVNALENISGQRGVFNTADACATLGSQEFSFADSLHYIRVGQGQFVDIQFMSSGIALDTRPGYRRTFTPYDHPMSLEKLRDYSLDPDVESRYDLQIPTWYGNNVMDNGWAVALYFRNFAIMFNNLGLKELSS